MTATTLWKNFELRNIFLNKWFWLVFCLSMFFIPIYKSVNRVLPPEIPKQFIIPDFTLIAENGTNFQWNNLRGRYVVVNFQFTRCPTICKDLMLKTQEVQKRVRGLGDKVAILTITVDPEFDTVEVLRNFATDNKANPLIWRFLTGNKKDVENVVMNYFKSPMEKEQKLDTSIFDIAHSGSFYLVDDEGWLRSTYTTSKDSLDRMMIDLGLMVNKLYYKK